MTELPDWARHTMSALDSKMGLELLEVTAQRTRGRMPVEGNTQPFGIWHGGASCVLAETLASLAGHAEVQPDGVAMGLELNATHHAPARDGWVDGVATAVHIGGRTATYEVVLTNGEQRICTARVTIFLKRGRR